jgi:hypothetical protein
VSLNSLRGLVKLQNPSCPAEKIREDPFLISSITERGSEFVATRQQVDDLSMSSQEAPGVQSGWKWEGDG